jgi:hypothetical protein
MMRRSLVVVGSALALAAPGVAGCADAGGPPEHADYVDAFVEGAEASGATADAVDQETNRCFAESAVGAIGVTRLQEAGVTPDEIRESRAGSPADLGVEVTERDGEEYYQRLSDCLDVREYLLRSLTGGADLADESVTCVEEAFDDELVRRVVVADFVEGRGAASSAVADELDAVYADCAPSG